MRALVTGATGFIGRHLVAELLRRGWEVTALVRLPARARVLPAQVRIVQGDLCDTESLQAAVLDCDVVFHLGAATSGDWPVHEAVTVNGTEHLLNACAAAHVPRFVLASSVAVYGRRHHNVDAPIDEDWPLLAADAAAGAYARGKLEAEALVHRHAATHPASTILRIGLVYGPDRVTFPHLGVPVGAVRIALGSPSLRLPLVEVGSVVDALIRVATTPQAAGKTYHAVDLGEISRHDYLRTLAELTGERTVVRYLPLWPATAICRVIAAARHLPPLRRLPDVSADKVRNRAVELRYDTSRLQRDTGWRPGPTIAEGLTNALGLPERRAPVDIERVGLIGAGSMAELHLNALRRIPGVEVVGIFDAVFESARRLGARDGIPAYDDIERFYADARPQLVHILTPPQTHATFAREALERGAHVLLEKPAVMTLMQCDALLAAARARNLTIGVDENAAWDPCIYRVRSLINNGVLGKPVHLEAFMSIDPVRRLASSSPDRPDTPGRLPWLQQLPGGILEDILPHPVSVSMRLAGGPLEPCHWESTVTGRMPWDMPDELRLSCKGPNALTASIGLSLAARPEDFLITLYGTRASVRIDLLNMLVDPITPLPGPKAVVRGARVLRSGLRAIGQTGVNALRIAIRRAEPPTSPLHLLRAHYAALASGRPLPAPLSGARNAVAIARTVWPEPTPRPALTATTGVGER